MGSEYILVHEVGLLRLVGCLERREVVTFECFDEGDKEVDYLERELANAI